MKNKPIIIVAGEPYSVFLEILFKCMKSKIKLVKNPILLIASKKIVSAQMKKLGFRIKIHETQYSERNIKLFKDKINLIDVNFKSNKVFDKVSIKSKNYIEKCFKIGIQLMSDNKGLALINGPVSKVSFLDKNSPGITEYLANKLKIKGKEVMLIYHKNLSVCPITTHFPLKNIFRELSIGKIMSKVKVINAFYKKVLKKKPKIGITGLNPHCESYEKFNEEKKLIIPAIMKLKKEKINIKGPFPADTIFLKKNRKNFDVIVGMYHDQVLGPAKTLYEFNAINITLGLPFIRITPDHGPNNLMLGKNKSDPSSLIEAFKFINNLRAN